jgi:hypothetical protein
MNSALNENLNKLASHQNAVITYRVAELTAKRKSVVSKQRADRTALAAQQEERQTIEQAARQAQFRKGLDGLFDQLTGKSRKIKIANETAMKKANQRDQSEKEALIFEQLGSTRVPENRVLRLQKMRDTRIHTLESEIREMNLRERQYGATKSLEPTSGENPASRQFPSKPMPSR